MTKIEFKEGMPVRVRFKKNLRSDGNLSCVSITQGDNEVQLTLAQAESLVKTLQQKIERTNP